jgi:hypothetical protein
MTALKGERTVRNLLNKGFIRASGGHNYLELWVNGKYVLQTFCSHNGQDIDDYLIAKMKRQCHLQKDQFLDLANCPLSKEKYIEILIDSGVIDRSDLSVNVNLSAG